MNPRFRGSVPISPTLVEGANCLLDRDGELRQIQILHACASSNELGTNPLRVKGGRGQAPDDFPDTLGRMALRSLHMIGDVQAERQKGHGETEPGDH